MTPEYMLRNFFYKSSTPSIHGIKDWYNKHSNTLHDNYYNNIYNSRFFNKPRPRPKISLSITSRTSTSTFDFKHPALKNASGSNHFDKLPDEVLLNIFQRLPKNKLGSVALVCCRFSRLIEDLTLWATDVLDLTGRILKPIWLEKLMERKVKYLILRGAEIPCLPCAIANDPSLQLLHLTDLDLTQAVFLQKTLIVLFGKCKNLKNLAATDVGDDALLALADGNQDLEYLALTFPYGTTGEGIGALLQNCGKLREFEFACTEITAEIVSIICSNLPSSLEHLSVLGYEVQLLPEHLYDIFANCPELFGLNVDFRRGSQRLKDNIKCFRTLTSSCLHAKVWYLTFRIKKNET